MKKLNFIVVCCVAAISGGISVCLETTGHKGSNDLQIQNIEALSYIEQGYDHACKDPGEGCSTDWNVWHPDLKAW